MLAPCSTGLLMPGMPDALGLPNTGLLAAPGECTREERRGNEGSAGVVAGGCPSANLLLVVLPYVCSRRSS